MSAWDYSSWTKEQKLYAAFGGMLVVGLLNSIFRVLQVRAEGGGGAGRGRGAPRGRGEGAKRACGGEKS
jgi:hypothetical protein